ncbi:hypothetical protein [Ideonella sp. BN130291]|uniref:hypothetical protein n=1 Tax=Ideonella sp. BN130291 TaxID=3112940 RepID=UPI002E26620B|nr:hypothetical protein [Ideonella sp. BN130291]
MTGKPLAHDAQSAFLKAPRDDLTHALMRHLAACHPADMAVQRLAALAHCEPAALQGHLLLLNRMGLLLIESLADGAVGSARLTQEGLRRVRVPAGRAVSPRAMRRKP